MSSVPPPPPSFVPPPPLLDPADEPLLAAESRAPRSRFECVTAAVIFSGLAVVLVLAAAVMVDPTLVDDFDPYWPFLAAIGFLSTVGGFWWLWWRPR